MFSHAFLHSMSSCSCDFVRSQAFVLLGTALAAAVVMDDFDALTQAEAEASDGNKGGVTAAPKASGKAKAKAKGGGG